MVAREKFAITTVQDTPTPPRDFPNRLTTFREGHWYKVIEEYFLKEAFHEQHGSTYEYQMLESQSFESFLSATFGGSWCVQKTEFDDMGCV